jgi:hypothetical protein
VLVIVVGVLVFFLVTKNDDAGTGTPTPTFPTPSAPISLITAFVP